MPMDAAKTTRPRVLIVDDNDAIRAALHLILERGCEIVGEVSRGHEAIGYCAELTPDVVLLDISLPDVSGFHIARKIIEHRPDSRIVFVSTNTSQPYIEEAFRLGACGYVAKSAACSELLDAIRTVAKGEIYIPKSHHLNTFKVSNALSVTTSGSSARAPGITKGILIKTHGTSGILHSSCPEIGRLLNAFAESVRALVELHQEQLRAIVAGDEGANRFDLLIHAANEHKQNAKYAYLKHLETHGCRISDGSKQR
jgi:DNA-binding NarL/FixJ family response regulator